ncbi:MAG: hypothetical protein ACE5GQ_11540, partial [Nitrospinales bacterium]
MPKYKQEKAKSPGRYSDILVGDKHYIADRPLNENLALSAGQLLGFEKITGFWVPYSRSVSEQVDFDANDKLTVAHRSVKNVVVKEAGNVKIEGTDYSVNYLSGEITRIGTGSISSH